MSTQSPCPCLSCKLPSSSELDPLSSRAGCGTLKLNPCSRFVFLGLVEMGLKKFSMVLADEEVCGRNEWGSGSKLNRDPHVAVLLAEVEDCACCGTLSSGRSKCVRGSSVVYKGPYNPLDGDKTAESGLGKAVAKS